MRADNNVKLVLVLIFIMIFFSIWGIYYLSHITEIGARHDCVRAAISDYNLVWSDEYKGGCMVEVSFNGKETLISPENYNEIIGKSWDN